MGTCVKNYIKCHINIKLQCPSQNYLRAGTSDGFTTLGFNRFGGLPGGLEGTAGARSRFLVGLINIGRGYWLIASLGFSIQDLYLITYLSYWSNHDWNLLSFYYCKTLAIDGMVHCFVQNRIIRFDRAKVQAIRN